MSAPELVPKTSILPAENGLQAAFPAVLVRAVRAACFAAGEFFRARISNPYTRITYARAVGQFHAWCEDEDLELNQVTPGQADRFIEQLPGGTATGDQTLAGLRQFFDELVARHAAGLNPFRSVREVRDRFGEERTPEVSVEQARQLLVSIDTDHVFGLRDRAVFGTFVYAGARVGALCRLRIQDLRDHGNHRTLQFAEKGGKVREIPVRHDLDVWIAAYIKGAALRQTPKRSALFRTGGAWALAH